MKIEAINWIRQAEADIKTSGNSLKSKDYYASAFWSHQVVEKCLKAILIDKSGELVKIHDLVILGRKVNLPENLLNGCEVLSKAYIESRYGLLDEEIPAEKFEKNHALKFLSIAKEVLGWAKKI